MEDEAALLMSRIGEKVSLKRALCLNVTDDLLIAGCTHPLIARNDSVCLGKYGAVLVYKTYEVDRELQVLTQDTDIPSSDIEDFSPIEIPDLAKELCQHIIGIVKWNLIYFALCVQLLLGDFYFM